ncbi:type IV secretory pathway TrbL component [Bradyrhizobium elkanii]
MLGVGAGLAVTIAANAVIAVVVLAAEAAAATTTAIAAAAVGTDATASTATAGRIDRAAIAALGGIAAEVDVVQRDVGVLSDEQAAAETRAAAATADPAIAAARNRVDDREVLERHRA